VRRREKDTECMRRKEREKETESAVGFTEGREQKSEKEEDVERSESKRRQ